MTGPLLAAVLAAVFLLMCLWVAAVMTASGGFDSHPVIRWLDEIAETPPTEGDDE